MTVSFSCLLGLCLVGFADCTERPTTCTTGDCDYAQSWAVADAADQEQGLELLQVKGSKVSARRVCPMPEFPALQEYGKGCPAKVPGTSGSTCLGGNKPYKTLQEAWAACGANPECGVILEHQDRKFYLRRATDPDTPAGQGSYIFKYDCPERRQEYEQQMAELHEAEHMKYEAAERAKMHHHRVAADIEALKASKEDDEKMQEKHLEKALTHDIMGGGLSEEDIKKEQRVLQSIQADLGHLYDKTEDTSCGWGNLEQCQWWNQAFVYNGHRNVSKVSREDALAFCGRICEEAGEECGGFQWASYSDECFFRKKTDCGVYERKGDDCFTKKSPPRPIADEDREAEQKAKEEAELAPKVEEQSVLREMSSLADEDEHADEHAELREAEKSSDENAKLQEAEESSDEAEQQSSDEPEKQDAGEAEQKSSDDAVFDFFAVGEQAAHEQEAAQTKESAAPEGDDADKKSKDADKESILKDTAAPEGDDAEKKSEDSAAPEGDDADKKSEQSDQKLEDADRKPEDVDKEHSMLHETDLHTLYEKSGDTFCGWGDEEPCQMENMAYVNNGQRNVSQVSREDAMTVCGRICLQAGSDCGGFQWDEQAGVANCWFRKKTVDCGKTEREGIDCFTKKLNSDKSAEEPAGDAAKDKKSADKDLKTVKKAAPI